MYMYPSEWIGDQPRLPIDISNNCRGLTKVIARHLPWTMYDSLVELFASYGPQLEVIGCHFFFINVEQRRRIVEVCPNAVFEPQTITPLDVLEDLNFKVHNLDISERAFPNLHDIKQVGEHGVDLRSLTIHRLNRRAQLSPDCSGCRSQS